MCPFLWAFRRNNGICQKSKQGINRCGIREPEDSYRGLLSAKAVVCPRLRMFEAFISKCRCLG
jgi:hypothetical protein